MKRSYLLLLCSIMFLSTLHTQNNNVVVKADNITTESNSALDSLTALRNNLNLLNEERSKAGYHTAVTSFTYSPIYIHSYSESNIAGFMVDFDGDKGYIVLGPNMTFYDDSFVGNSPVPMSNAVEKHFSQFEGYYYYENNQKIELGRVNDPTYNTDSVELMDGQIAPGESLITDVEAYNTDKYGSGYVYEGGKSIFSTIYMPGYMDMYLSYYYIYNNGNMTYPEISAYVAGYDIGKYLAYALNHTSFKSENEVVNYSPATAETNNYNYFISQGYSCVSNISISTFENSYRYRVLYYFDHEDELGVSDIYYALNQLYSNQLSYTSYSEDDFCSSIMGVFNNNYPVLWEFNDSEYYGQKILPLCGYKKYTKTRNYLLYTRVDVRYYLEYKDGSIREQSLYIDHNFTLDRCGAIYSVEF